MLRSAWSIGNPYIFRQVNELLLWCSVFVVEGPPAVTSNIAGGFSGEKMETDDFLVCPNCGSTDVKVTRDFQPGQWSNGCAKCRWCGLYFQFAFEEEEPSEGPSVRVLPGR